MTRNEYNGWYNYETWSFNLHWDDAFREDAQMFYDASEASKSFTKAEQAAINLSEHMRDMAQEILDQLTPKNPWVQDMISGAFSEINFHEIAKHYIEKIEAEQEAA